MTNQSLKSAFSIKKHPLSIVVFLTLFLESCDYFNTASSQEETKKEEVTARVLRELNYLDNGAVVPMPAKRRVQFFLTDSTAMQMKYARFQVGEAENDVKTIDIDAYTCEDLRYQIERLAEKSSDGDDIKLGKMLCVGANSLDVALIYSTGDTVRFSVTSGARCDRALYPHLWAIDSVAKILVDR